MNIISELKEYKEKVEALAAKAALSDNLTLKVSEIETEKESIAAKLAEKESLLAELAAQKEAAETEAQALKDTIAGLEAEKKSSDEQALEIVASLGLKNIPVITVTETDKPTAESIRAKYLAITDSEEKGRFYAENRDAIINGYIG